MRFPTIFSSSKLQNWKLMIKELSSKGQWQEVLTHYHEMRKMRVLLADPTLFPPILKACTNLCYLKEGISIHAYVIKQGLEQFTSIANSTMDFYMKYGVVNSALHVFTSMGSKDSVSWNIVIHGCLDQGASEEGLWLFTQARVAGFEPNISTLVLVLQACRGFRGTHEVLSIHGFIIRSGFMAVVSIQNSLLSVYAESCNMNFALWLFEEMPDRDVISWSVMIGGYVQSGEGQVAFWLFKEMFSSVGVEPDERTVVSMLKACTSVRDIDQGQLIHGYVIRRGFNFDMFVGNSLVDMYSKCNDANSAFEVFNEMPRRNIVSWNSILSGFIHNEWYFEALTLFNSMGKARLEADEVTLVTLIQLCKNRVDPALCKSIHSRIIRRGFELNELMENSLIDAYAKCNLVELAWNLFERMEIRDMVSWSTMITALSRSGKPEMAVSLFGEMALVGEKFNSVTMLSVLEACSVLAELRKSKWAHGLAIRSGLATEVAVGTALLDMYSKCGAIDASRRVFYQMPERNVVSWSAMIKAYGMNGHVHDALALLAGMEKQGVKPNEVTILSVLSACSHGGLVKHGLSWFKKMVQDHGFEPGSEHYSCLVDMLGRSGDLKSAIGVIEKMPEELKAGASVWGALLSACRNYGNSDLGEGAASRVLELEPSKSAGYMLASNMYAASGLWGDAAKMRQLVKEKRMRVVAGYSLVHVENRAYRFVAGNSSHPQFEEISAMVEDLHSCMKMGEKNDVFKT